MLTLSRQLAALAGVFALTASALPAVQAQTAAATPDGTTTPGTTTPDTTTPGTATTPGTSTPDTNTPSGMPQATPVPVSAPPSPPQRSSRFRIGPAIGVYLPSSSKTRNRFGDTWVGIGIGLGSINPVSTHGAVTLDANLFYHGRDGNHAFFFPVGVGYRIALSPSTSVIPYAGVSADVNFADITSNPDNVHNSFTVGGGGSAFVGVNFGDRAFVEARYLALSKASGFDLSGLSLSAGYRF